jgi:alpha-1,2-mannosyltransferase
MAMLNGMSARGFRGFGLDRLVVMFTLVFTAFALVLIVSLRPDYVHPTELGTDVATYFAAGQRLLAGHEIYALSPGDRPVPIWPPFWTVPLVGPPTIAVIWAPLVALVPPIVSIYGWWLAAFLVTTAVFVWTVLRGHVLVAVAAAALSFATIITGLTGNMNGLLIGALCAMWFVSQRSPTTRRDVAIGFVVALAAALKFGPAIFGLWLLAMGRWRAAAAAAVAGVAIALVTVIVAGPDIVPTYLSLAADTATGGVTPYSAGGILQGLGLPHGVVVAAPVLVAVICGALAFVLRRHPAVVFSIVAIGVTFALPVVRFESLSFLFVALIPWTRGRRAPGSSSVATPE